MVDWGRWTGLVGWAGGLGAGDCGDREAEVTEHAKSSYLYRHKLYSINPVIEPSLSKSAFSSRFSP
jgi:hypothetical protein